MKHLESHTGQNSRVGKTRNYNELQLEVGDGSNQMSTANLNQITNSNPN